MGHSSARACAALLLVCGLAWMPSASAVDLPSTYPGCATRSVTVPWGGSVVVDLGECHHFGLGVVARAPEYGSATPDGPEPLQKYRYTHGGASPEGGGLDRFIVLDDNSDLITVTVTVRAAASSLAGAPTELPRLQAGDEYRLPLAARGGQAPYTFQLVAGALPVGMALEENGLLSGIPTRRGPYAFTLRLQDARAATASLSYSGVIEAAPLSVSPTTATAVPGIAVSQRLAARGGVAPHRFQLEPGPGLPPGLVLSGDGVISGTTTVAPGRYPVTLRITDGSSGSGSHFELEAFTMIVDAAPATTTALPSVSITVSPAAVAEDDGEPLVFTVSRGESLPTPTVVRIATTGTANTRAPDTVTIPAGATRIRINSLPFADDFVEDDETVVLTVLPGDGYVVGEPASATGTIVNDDFP